MCGHAGTVGTLRPVRRPPPPAGWPGTGRRPGQAARAARHRRRRPFAPRSPGWCARAGCTRSGWPPDPGIRSPRRPPAGSTRRPPGSTAPAGQLGRPVRPDRARARRPPAATGSGSPPTWPSSATARSTSSTWVATRAGRGGRRRCSPRPASASSGSPPRTPPAPPARWRWSGGPGTWPRSAAATSSSSRTSARCSPRSPRAARDEEAYAARFRLVHAWRTFLFRDPQLPPALLPERWPGTARGRFFDRHAARLRPAADRYVEQCLDAGNRARRDRRDRQTP